MITKHSNLRWLSSFVLVVCLGAALAAAQNGDSQKAKPYVPRKIVISPQPVTRDEARKIFEKVNKCLGKVIAAPKAPVAGMAGPQPVSRAEIVDQLNRVFEAAKPAFTYTPKKVGFDPSLLTIKSGDSKAHLETLIAWGCVDRVGPLATSGKDTLGVLEFGDAVGFFMARVAQLSHYPDARFTPELEP